jgi:1,2-diacylglycerol 3-beta-galactosyltransferase
MSVLETVYHWLDADRALLAERAENARRLGCPDAAHNIAELVWTADQIIPSPPTDSQNDRLALIELLERYQVPWR